MMTKLRLQSSELPKRNGTNMKKILFFIILLISSSFGTECAQLTYEELEELGEDNYHPQIGLKCSQGDSYTGFYYRGIIDNNIDILLVTHSFMSLTYCVCRDNRKNKNTILTEMPSSLMNYNIIYESFYDEYGLAISEKEKHTKLSCTDLYKSCKNLLK